MPGLTVKQIESEYKFCAKCGKPMIHERTVKGAGFDRRTGERKVVVYHMIHCPDFNVLEAGHDSLPFISDQDGTHVR